MLLAAGLVLLEVTRRSNLEVREGVHTIRGRSGTLSRILVSYLSFASFVSIVSFFPFVSFFSFFLFS